MLKNVNMPMTLNWIRVNMPLSEEVMKALSLKTYGSIKIAYAGHIEPKMIPHILFFAERGVNFHVSPCVPGIAHLESFEFLKANGIKTSGVNATTWNELEIVWESMLKETPDFIFDIGGGLIAKAHQLNLQIKSACEATSTGVTLLKNKPLSFPVLNWNDIPFKNLLHNRYEVGSGLWCAFRNLTGLDLCRLNVGVVGFGLVGQSVAAIAKGMGARVMITDIAPIRELAAASEGYLTGSIETLSSTSDVIITATGFQDILNSENLKNCKSGLIIANAGHDIAFQKKKPAFTNLIRLIYYFNLEFISISANSLARLTHSVIN